MGGNKREWGGRVWVVGRHDVRKRGRVGGCPVRASLCQRDSVSMWSHILIRLCVLLIISADLAGNPAITPAPFTVALCLLVQPYLWALPVKRHRYLGLNSFIWAEGAALASLQPPVSAVLSFIIHYYFQSVYDNVIPIFYHSHPSKAWILSILTWKNVVLEVSGLFVCPLSFKRRTAKRFDLHLECSVPHGVAVTVANGDRGIPPRYNEWWGFFDS